MTDVEYQRQRAMWAAALVHTIKDFKRRIVASRNRDSRRYNFYSISSVISTTEIEIDTARRYLNSADFREVCDLAGVSPKSSAVMEWLLDPESDELPYATGAAA